MSSSASPSSSSDHSTTPSPHPRKDIIRYSLKDSPLSYLNTSQFLYKYFGAIHYPCHSHWRQYLELYDICREFYDIRRDDNMKNLRWGSQDVRPGVSGKPLSMEKFREGSALFHGDMDRYKKMCTMMVDKFDACMLHEFDSYARQCLDMHTVDDKTGWYHLRSCLRDRDINILYKVLYQRSTKLLDQHEEGKQNVRRTLYQDLSAYKNQCSILKQKYVNCMMNQHSADCLMEQYKYVACEQLNQCETELKQCGESFKGAHDGDLEVAQWHCLEYGGDVSLGSAIPNIDALSSCLQKAQQRSLQQL